MSMGDVIDLGKACGRKLSEAEAARLREVGNRLNLREDDALWPLLAAMEYQRIYYEALPEKIAGASRTIMDGMAAAAEKETAAAQAKLTDSVMEEARNLASKIQFGKLVPMGLLALICLLAYGSLMLWAGFRIDTGKDIPLAAFLHMPSGWLISGLCLAAGVFSGCLTAKQFSCAQKGWGKKVVVTIIFVTMSGLLFCLSV